MMTRTARHKAILEIIGKDRIASQEDLKKRLRRKGFRVTQPTLSRDISEMGIVKSVYGYLSSSPEKVFVSEEEAKALLTRFVTGSEVVGNLIVVKTSPGGASAAARVIDGSDWGGVAGTVAGDDTILVICRTVPKAREVMSAMKRTTEK